MTDSTPESGDQPVGRTAMRPRWLSAPPMRYPNLYVWFVFVSAMDVLLTKVILRFRNAEEVNPITAAIIETWGFNGAIIFKFCLVLFVIIVCEVVGRKRDRLGRGLAVVGVIVSASPVVYSFVLLAWHLLLAGEIPEIK
jgi:hypothetical protein